MASNPKLISAIQKLTELTGREPTPQEIREKLIPQMKPEEFQDIPDEPSLFDKAMAPIDKGLDLRDQAEKYLLNKFLPEKKISDLSPDQVKNLNTVKAEQPDNFPRILDKYLATKTGEEPIDLLNNPRFIAHPELAKGLNSLASLANVMSPSNDLMKYFGVPQGGHLSDISPRAARMVGDLSARDAAGLASDFAIPHGLNILGKTAATAAEASKPNLYSLPSEGPQLQPKPIPPFAYPEIQEYADMVRRGDALGLKKRANTAISNTANDLKQPGLSNANTAAKIVNSYDLPISKDVVDTFAQGIPDHPEVQKLINASSNTATGEARTQGNLVNPREDFIADQGEKTPITIVPTSDPVIGEPHPSATIDYRNDPRFKTQFQEGAQQTLFPKEPLMGEAAYTTTQPLDYNNPILGNEGQQKLYTKTSDIGSPDQVWHTPETNPTIGADQATLPFQKNPDLYKLLQLANEHAKYAPQDLSPTAMQARNAKFGQAANELRSTIKNINEPLPANLSEEDLANLQRAGGDGTTGEQVQNIRNDTTNRIGLQKEVIPAVRNSNELSLINSAKKGVNDKLAIAQDAAQNYGAPDLANEIETARKADQHIQDQADYFDQLYKTQNENRKASQKYQRDIQNISTKNAKILADFGARGLGFLPSRQDVYNLGTRSIFAPVGSSLGILGVEKAGALGAYGLTKAGAYAPQYNAMGASLKNPWQDASIIGNTMAPQEGKK